MQIIIIIFGGSCRSSYSNNSISFAAAAKVAAESIAMRAAIEDLSLKYIIAITAAMEDLIAITAAAKAAAESTTITEAFWQIKLL